MHTHYILTEQNEIVEEPDLMKWGLWFSSGDRRISRTTLSNGVVVSTIFLGLDYNLRRNGLPLLFETMVFGGKYDQCQERYCTISGAKQGHIRWVLKAKRKWWITIIIKWLFREIKKQFT